MWSLLLVRDRSWNSIGSTIAFILERCKFPLIFLNIVFLGFTCPKAWMTNAPSPSLVSNWLFAMCSKNRLGWPLNNGNGLYNRKRVYAYRFQRVKTTKITGNEQIVHNSPTACFKQDGTGTFLNGFPENLCIIWSFSKNFEILNLKHPFLFGCMVQPIFIHWITVFP